MTLVCGHTNTSDLVKLGNFYFMSFLFIFQALEITLALFFSPSHFIKQFLPTVF